MFIIEITCNVIAHAHLYAQNMEAEKEKELVALEWNHKHSNKICEQIIMIIIIKPLYNNIIYFDNIGMPCG